MYNNFPPNNNPPNGPNRYYPPHQPGKQFLTGGKYPQPPSIHPVQGNIQPDFYSSNTLHGNVPAAPGQFEAFPPPSSPGNGQGLQKRKRKPTPLAIGCGVLMLALLLCACPIAVIGANKSQTTMTPTPTTTSNTVSQIITPSPTEETQVEPTATPTQKPAPTPTSPTIAPEPTPTPYIEPTQPPAPTPTQPPAPTPTQPPAPTPTQPPTTGVNGNPWGYDFNPGTLIYEPNTDFCTYFNCLPTFWIKTNGYVVECADGLVYSHSGGVRGSCSRHGGDGRILYSH